MTMMPSLFLSHGAPLMAIEEGPATYFWREYGAALGRPTAILVISAHWQTAGLRVTASERPALLYDFYGFPPALYTLRYDVAGAPALAMRVIHLLKQADIAATPDRERGLDHGVWVPLRHMYPAADIPVVQLSLPRGESTSYHYALGQALRPLRSEGVLILASGSATHNLGELDFSENARPPLWAQAFREWLLKALEDEQPHDILNYRTEAPYATRNHPTEEHLLPLFVALGAKQSSDRLHTVFADYSYGSLAMDAYAFHEQ